MRPTQVPFPGAARDFSPRVNFQCRLSYGVHTPPCAIACIYIYEPIKDPVVHVRVWWIKETLTHPACRLDRLDSTTLSQLAFPREGNLNFPGEKSHWDYTVVKKKVKVIQSAGMFNFHFSGYQTNRFVQTLCKCLSTLYFVCLIIQLELGPMGSLGCFA